MLGLQELQGEIVSCLTGIAMEVLGFKDAPESCFCDQTFMKSKHPGFVDLLHNNNFLSVGDDYLQSDQIVKVSLLGVVVNAWAK